MKKNKNRNLIYPFVGIIVILLIVIITNFSKKDLVVNNFEECVAAGNKVMESYPRQCRYKDQVFTEDIGNEIEKSDYVILKNPRPNQIVISPLQVSGEARGYWFFEAEFPVILEDSQGNVLARSIAFAQENWMTVDFVEFKSELIFDKPQTASGYLILKKDNPSGLEENDDSLKIPVKF